MASQEVEGAPGAFEGGWELTEGGSGLRGVCARVVVIRGCWLYIHETHIGVVFIRGAQAPS
jgi:hypothetical protein